MNGIVDQVSLTRFFAMHAAADPMQYLRFVKGSYDNFVQPSSKHADIVSLARRPACTCS